MLVFLENVGISLHFYKHVNYTLLYSKRSPMSIKNHESGPFGNYLRGTPGHVLNALHASKVPINVVDRLTVGQHNVLKQNGSEFAIYKYFDGIDRPLFRFQDQCYQNVTDSNNYYIPVIGPHDNPALILTGEYHADWTAWSTINEALSNDIRNPFYALHKDAGTFFQGGSDWIEGGWYLYVEFWKPAGAQAWLDAFNVRLKLNRQKQLAVG